MLVRTRDGIDFGIPDPVVPHMGTLRDAAEFAGSGGVVPVPEVAADSLAVLVRFYTKVAELRAVNVPAMRIDAYKTGFFRELDRGAIPAVMNAADYLRADELLDDMCGYLADLIRLSSPEQIRELLGLPLDMTAADAAGAAQRLGWAIP